MKKMISVFCLLTAVCLSSFAQKTDKDNWREKVRSEQVALITSELDLSEAEAQAFWPVYNAVQQQRRDAFKAMSEAFKALKEGAEGKDASTLLDQYLAAKKNSEAVEAEAVVRYKKVLPVEKVAKLLVAEEKFRHQQIGKLSSGRAGKNHREGRRP